MKILLVTNKTLNRNGTNRVDIGYWNFYIPLLELGHDVYFFDTVNPEEKDFESIINNFKPDLIFSCISGNEQVTPYEPLDLIKRETESGRTKTFNWFCDDTWRFESFSLKYCNYFNYCSTPEPSFVEKYKQNNYDNIILGNWHTNLSLYPKKTNKKIKVGFCGHINQSRYSLLRKINNLDINLATIYGPSYEDMLDFYASCNIGINFSINENDPQKKTQMKLRMFEVPAANAMLLTEHHSTIENFFDIHREIVTFKTEEEMISKLKYYLNNENALEKISKLGFERVKKEHQSKIRLKEVLEHIR